VLKITAKLRYRKAAKTASNKHHREVALPQGRSPKNKASWMTGPLQEAAQAAQGNLLTWVGIG
jgi:hypothetical protein